MVKVTGASDPNGRTRLLIASVLAIALGLAFPHATSAAPLRSVDEDALTAVTHDALVESLIDECGFDSVFFEASHAEFINLARRFRTNQAVFSRPGFRRGRRTLEVRQGVSNSVVPFLLAKVQAGKISFLKPRDAHLGADAVASSLRRA
jgi:hypothetical protein